MQMELCTVRWLRVGDDVGSLKSLEGSRYFTSDTLLNFNLINNELFELCFLLLKATVL
jgi:hypothetical protein